MLYNKIYGFKILGISGNLVVRIDNGFWNVHFDSILKALNVRGEHKVDLASDDYKF